MRISSPDSRSLVILQIVGIGHLVDHLLGKDAVIIMLTKHYCVKYILEDTLVGNVTCQVMFRRLWLTILME